MPLSIGPYPTSHLSGGAPATGSQPTSTVVIKELPDNTPNNIVLLTEKEPLPIAFQVELGAYINAIGSSLDILACTLSERHCPSLIDDTYFPVASSQAHFHTWNFKGNKFVKALPAKERGIIEICLNLTREGMASFTPCIFLTLSESISGNCPLKSNPQLSEFLGARRMLALSRAFPRDGCAADQMKP